MVDPNEVEEYDYAYYDDTPVESVFVNPYDKSHHQPQLLAGNLAGHLAGLYREPEPKPLKKVTPRTRSHRFCRRNKNFFSPSPQPDPLRPIPDQTRRFFPPGELKFDRFADGFNFKFRSN